MPIPAMIGLAIGASAVSAGASVIGGISQSQAASEANARAQENYEAQRKAAEAAAARQNEYNKRVHEADKENYRRQRAYEWETAVKSWQYNQEVQDFQYLQTVKQYGKSVENTQDQLTYNNIAAMQASEAEQAALNEIMNETAFTTEGVKTDSDGNLLLF